MRMFTPNAVLGDPLTIDVSLGPLDCHVVGTGRPVLLLHGLMVNAAHWRHLVPELLDGFRCIVPTLPMGSHSRAVCAADQLSIGGLASAVEDLLENLGADEALVVGSDTGAMVAQALMARAATRVRDVVLLPGDTWSSFRPWDIRFRRQSGLPHRGLFDYERFSKRGVPPEVIAGYTHPVTASSAVREDLDRLLESLSDPAAVVELRDVGRFQGELLLAWAADEPIFGIAGARQVSQEVPGARLELIADTYAYVAEDQPELLGSLIRDWAAYSRRARGALA